MKRTIVFTTFLIFCLSAAIESATKINFTGTWVMDRSRSIGMPADMQQTMTVLHAADDKIEVETKIVTAQGERIVRDNFSLDGKESEFTPQGSLGRNIKARHLSCIAHEQSAVRDCGHVPCLAA